MDEVSIGRVVVDPPTGVAPMAGMTDTAFRRLVKRHGGCGLVVTEMVSSEGLVRGIDRTLEYAEYTEAERPVSIQIFGGDPARMAEAAAIVEGMGADVVDINMGCPVPKIAKHHAGCSLMREPAHAADIVRRMADAVKIPVTVKMRAGWNEAEVNAPELAAACPMPARRPSPCARPHGHMRDYQQAGWNLVAGCRARRYFVRSKTAATSLEAADNKGGHPWASTASGRGAACCRTNPVGCLAGRQRLRARARERSPRRRGRFLLDYIDLLLDEHAEQARLPSPRAHTSRWAVDSRPAQGRERWIHQLRSRGCGS